NNYLSKFIEFIPNVEVIIEDVRILQGFHVIKAASFNILLESDRKKALFIISIVLKNWINLSNCEDDYEDNNVEDLMTMQRVDIEPIFKK
ncbi:5253_t:CDS:2, partial [Gigaspora margarita]